MTNEEIKRIVILEIVAPYSGESELPQNIRDEIFRRYKAKMSWEEVFACTPLGYPSDKWIDLFNELDKTPDDIEPVDWDVIDTFD